MKLIQNNLLKKNVVLQNRRKHATWIFDRLSVYFFNIFYFFRGYVAFLGGIQQLHNNKTYN